MVVSQSCLQNLSLPKRWLLLVSILIEVCPAITVLVIGLYRESHIARTSSTGSGRRTKANVEYFLTILDLSMNFGITTWSAISGGILGAQTASGIALDVTSLSRGRCYSIRTM